VETWGWWTLAGLVADIVGAAVLAAGLIISKERAIELGGSRLAFTPGVKGEFGRATAAGR